MVTTNRSSHDETGTVPSSGRRLLVGLLVAATLALAAPAVAEARDNAREDGATVVIGGLVGQSSPLQASAGGGAIGIGDYHCPCWQKGCC